MEEYEITYNDGFSVFTFQVAMSLAGGTTSTLILQQFVNRVLDNGFVMREFLTLQIRFYKVAQGMAMALTILQVLRINELLTAQE